MHRRGLAASSLTDMVLLMFLAVTASLLGYCQTDEKVSFYGASYIHLPVQEAKGATDISFRFRTHLADAMLLLAAGKTDYCLIKLEAGRLKVHINLGAGENEIASARGLTLNDLAWHEVNLTRREANISLQIDVIHATRSQLPGRFFELNIHYGVYIGGQGDFHELFLGHTDYLRGCMADIVYNGARVIEYARSRRGQSEATAVTWGCSPEFDATRGTEISFVEDGAFVAIPRTIPRSGSRWEFELKTGADGGLLLYNTGLSSYADYLGVELYEGKIRLLMNKGNGPSELIHGTMVADGKWHGVVVDFNPSGVSIAIDRHEKTMALPSGGNRFLDLADTLYIGGTELNKRARALGKGLRSGDVSYKGCIRNMVLDDRDLGLPDAKVSQGVVVGCVWGYPCAEAEPCVTGATCTQLGVSSFRCDCEQSLCIKPSYADDYKIYSNATLPVNLEILSLSPLLVAEGEHMLVTSENIAMVLDIAKYGVAEDGVIFTLVTPPIYGTLALDLLTTRNDHSFTLQDVNQDKIQYMHDGSETTEDSMILELTLVAGTGYTLPGYLQGHLRFPLHVNVTPVNDPPLLEIPTAKVLRLAQGTRKTLTKELIWAIDADTPSDMLVYTVLRADTDAGHIERVTYPFLPIDTFTQAELMQGLIAYVHRGNGNATTIAKPNAMLGLQVSDGIESSQPAYLRVSAYPLQIKLTHNTGLVVVHRSFSYVTPANLSFATNSDDNTIDIRYDVVAPPQHGALQKRKDMLGTWANVDHFTSRDVELHVVRYLHTVGSPSQDEFKFQASVREVRTQQTYDFRITFIDLELREARRASVNLTGTPNATVTAGHLRYQTNPLVTAPSKIVFTVATPPRYGDMILSGRKLTGGDTFAQEDIETGNLIYRLFRRAYSNIHDEMTYRVSAPQCIDIHASLKLRYHVGKNGKSLDATESLRVDEGGRVPLRIARVNPRDYGVASLTYNLTMAPSHGWLAVTNDSQTQRNVSSFTLDELSARAVYYVHDDSETMEDKFEFVAVSLDTVDFMYVGRFHVDVTMRNDNPPERTVDRVFHVVSKGERLITGKDLAYTDKDLGTKPSELVYTRRDARKSGIYRVTNPAVQIREFTQQDIDDGAILLRHQGDERDGIEFGITDGHYHRTGVLEIQASSPYVRLRESNGTVVQYNRSVVMRARELEIETNVYATEKDVRYTVMEKPRNGALLKHGRESSGFTEDDLRRGAVVYKHLGGSLAKDTFKFRVQVKGAETEGVFAVKVYPESYWEPLIVQSNKTIFVEEATSVLLSRKSLEIMHPSIPSSEIVYFVQEWPQHGYLELQTHGDEHSDEEHKEDYSGRAVEHFEQSLVNDGRVFYVQSATNQTNDRFVADVTNGIAWLRGLSVNFVIVPERLYVEATGVTVVEGKSVVLNESNFVVVTSYYAGKVTDYRMVEKPRHGTLLDSTKNAQVRKFSQKHLNAGVVLYKHNGDESATDSFRMVVTAGDKTSEPFDVTVAVQPINDEVPVLVNRTRLNIWQGGTVVLTPADLAAVDNDSAPRDVTFNVTGVRNGYISLTDAPDVDVYNFTQSQIDESRVLFTHTNGTDGEFNFVLSDGVHTTESYTILVATKPVRLSVEHNMVLNVFPLTRKLISDKLLLTTCSDEAREIRYTVRNGPHLGKVIMETSEGVWLEVERFTQRDVNNSRVIYEHTKQFMDLAANDSFTFDVETHFAGTLTNQIFQIDISVSSGGLDRYIAARSVTVTEGGSAQVVMNISGIVSFLRVNAGIESPAVLSRLVHQPSHGHVMLLPDMNVTTFTQPQIEGGKIAYYHDHSDTLEDRIPFSLYLTPGHVLLCNASVPVVVLPVNDEPFKLITNSPYISVVQNQNQTIMRDHLLTTDPDTPPEEIVYDVISGPTYGRLLLLPFDQNTSEVHQVNRFSQHDVDSNRLVYEHNGRSLQPASFYFRVWDGRFNPVYRVFNVHVLPIRLNVTVAGPVGLQQGSNVALISENDVRLDTNARQDLVVYEITTHPKHGVLYVRDGAAATFKQTDLLSKSVMFMQTDMTVSNDSLELSARLSGFEQERIRVNIKVMPLMIMNPMTALAGEKNQITLRHLDATPLAKLTTSNPLYTVVRKPRYGRIKRIIRSSSSSGEKRGTREREIARFSHQEVVSGVIYLVCRKIPSIEYEGVADSFGFVLAASIFQPATGDFEFRIKHDVDDDNITLGGPMDPVGHEGEMAIAPNMSNDYLLILGMLVGVFLLGVVVIITIRCRQNRYKHAEEEKPESAPAVGVMPLPRPPDHLMPATPHLKPFGNDHNSVTASTPLPVLPSTLPQCKVIPLTPLESGSEVDVSARYPYGVADGDEWSSFDTSDLPCQSATAQRTKKNPLLRRDQYWV